jgi:hypothetical protein
MLKLLAFVLMNLSMLQAAELVALDLPASKVGPGVKGAYFEVGANGEAGVRLQVFHHRHMNSEHKSFEAVVPELTWVSDKLMLNGVVDCGTMGISRVFKIPTLNLSGNCDLEVRIVKTEAGKRVQVILLSN